MDLEKLTTEKRNEKTMQLDEMNMEEILYLINNEDQTVPKSVEKEIPQIKKVVEAIVTAFQNKGRLIYMGAGTSGRLGILDAAECVPTFGTPPEKVVGLIAGGISAMTVAVEGAEDSEGLAKCDLQELQLNNKDIVIGIAASGRTPYVVGGLKYANDVGATTASIACNKNAVISTYATLPIEVEVGPEILTGSTRLKSGTAQKLILNMLSTVSMISIGKIYKNLMVDVKPTNEKLIERSKRIIMQATDCTYEESSEIFEQANRDVKLAIVMLLTNLGKGEAKERLKEAKGFVRKAL
ncbi:N-acetylmuramic acid 6-phosphate etherase [Rummeliibacillus pycnus]|uniref:N-acetylmuramic acid 6-phosphate etherase n=1 Tax=Rummeliibacillus pycnus TaxID=101070 RepID=UPI003D27DEC0